MMDWTDRHCRYFHRQMSRHARLYTEMITAEAVIHGDRARLLAHHPAEHPLALQLGGADPEKLAEAARIGADFGYDEINLNCGCPSDRVRCGAFGAALMATPRRVGACVAAMKAAVAVPVTVKCRIGIDDQDAEADLDRFVEALVAAGVDGVIVHARKAWLKGLSPKENREVPPLDHARVYRLKATYPDLPVILNGGIATLDDAARHLAHVDGVMLGRAAYRNPVLLLDVDRRFHAAEPPHRDAEAVVAAMIDYVDDQRAAGVPVAAITRHMLGLFQGMPGARAWRRILTIEPLRKDADARIIARALAAVTAPKAVLDNARIAL